MPAVSDRARSPAAAEKISNEANEVTSPLLAYAACGSSVLYCVMTEGCSEPCSSRSDDKTSPGAPVCAVAYGILVHYALVGWPETFRFTGSHTIAGVGRCTKLGLRRSSKFGKQSRTDAQTLLLTVRPQRVLYAPGLARRRPTHAHSSTHASRLYTILDPVSLANSLVGSR